MTYQNILYEVKDKVATITLNRPERLNAMNDAMVTEVMAALREADHDDKVSVIVLKGAGRAFCSGYESSPEGLADPKRSTVDRERNWLFRDRNRWLSILTLLKPVIAQVHGYCITTGTEIATLADLTIVAEDARISPSAVAGPIGAANISPLLAWAVGAKKAKEICFRIGYFFSGKEAERMGWANKAVPAARLEEEVQTLAREIAKTPLSFLILEKAAINRLQEALGIRAAFLCGPDLDAVSHFTEEAQDFIARVREKGLRQASAEWKESLKEGPGKESA